MTRTAGERDTEAKKKGYPRPLVVHKEARDKALKMYKEGIGSKP